MATGLQDTALERLPSSLLPSMQQSRTSSVYQPLDRARYETRILIITTIEPLRFNFEYASMTDDHLEPFDTISWCWGNMSAGHRRAITVEGHDLLVPENAYQVLLELCVPNGKRRIWIDAVCINQDDLQERANQVAMMDYIYKKAAMTLVWLGRDYGSAKSGMESIKMINNWRQTQHRNVPPDVLNDGYFDEETTDPFPSNIDWAAVMSLFSAEWFTRLWVVQEVVLSRHTHAFQGEYEVCWKYLSRAAHYIIHNDVTLKKLMVIVPTGLENALTIDRIQNNSMSITVLLGESEDFGATDPRDRIFALYGLLQSKLNKDKAIDSAAYSPDYTKRLVDVYIDATRASMNATHGIAWLPIQGQCLVPRIGCDHPDTDFPSWVPRYHFVRDKSPGSYRRQPFNRWVATSTIPTGQGDSLGIDLNTPRQILRIGGVILDTISETMEPLFLPFANRDTDDADNNGHSKHVLCSRRPCKEHIAELVGKMAQMWYAAIARNSSRVALPKLATELRMVMLGRPSPRVPHCREDPKRHDRRSFRQFINSHWNTATNYPTEEASSDQEEVREKIDDSDLEDEYSSEEDNTQEVLGHPAPPSPWPSIINTASRRRELLDSVSHETCFWIPTFEVHMNRRFLVTSSGRMGSAPPRSQPGDKICILAGIGVPIVLRPMNDGGWILIGDVCFIGLVTDESVNGLNWDGGLQGEGRWFDLK